MPKDAKGAIPVVLFVEGSDSGDTRASGYVRALANTFAKFGIGVFAFNKRGNEGSEGPDSDNDSYDNRADDVVAAYRFLSTRPDIEANHIGVFGISQAGWVVPRALKQLKNIPFVILASPGGVSAAEQVDYYLQCQWRNLGLSPQQVVSALDLHQTLARYFATGKGYSFAQKLVDRSVKQPWFQTSLKAEYREDVPKDHRLPKPDELAQIWTKNPDLYGFYHSAQTWADEVECYRDLTAPLLLIYGGRDEKVPIERSFINIQGQLRLNQNKDVTLRIYEAADHGIQPLGEPRLYPGYREDMASWILKHIAP